MLALLYTAQGIPFGFAAEYLPVVLRERGYTMTQIALVAWLQLPWQLKVLWASVADRPSARRRARGILLVVQIVLALTVAAYAPFSLADHAPIWFAITAFAAFVAATQDIFVDALAVRMLEPKDLGLGNVAQVAGYRLGMLGGGAGLLLVSTALGEPATLLACGGFVALAGLGAFTLRVHERADVDDAPRADVGAEKNRLELAALAKHMVAPGVWPALALALTYKLGLHAASAVLKPMVVDAGWTKAQIGWAVVTIGTVSALAGAAVGGLVHRVMREPRALAVGGVFQALVCVPLFAAAELGAPRALTTLSIAVEHFASGLGTTVLFAALMSATRRSNAGLHYTALTSANAIAIGAGSLAGGALGDALGKPAVFVIAFAVSLAPLVLVRGWDEAARASAGAAS